MRDQLNSALVGRYTIEREIGRGGMATVFLARDHKHDRRVAIKVLDAELGAVLGVERFLAEIRVTANLQHPNILPLFDSGEAAGQLYYVMPFVDGETLRGQLERERQLPVDEAVRMASAMAGALAHAHAAGVIHRDLKPENVLLQSGQPVIADFGIALAVSNAGGARVTQTGISLGTPQYMSPEQASGEREIDARSDQYSLAAMLYEMLAGEPPHTGATSQVIMARLMTEAPRALRTTRASVPPAVEAAVARALSKAPADRFATMSAFAAALVTTTSAASVTDASGSAAVAPRRRSAILGVSAILVLAAVAAGAWFTRSAPERALDSRAVLVFRTAAAGDPALQPLARRVDDALVQGIGGWPWASVRTAASATESDVEAASAAREAGAMIAVVPLLRAGGSDAELSVRLVDARSAQVVRQLAPVTLARAGDAAAIRRAVEPATVAAGFVTNRSLGVVALPSGNLPQPDAFRLYQDALETFRSEIGTAGRLRAVDALRSAIQADSTFLQSKLMLGVLYGLGSYFGRWEGGAARADSVERWAADAVVRGTAFERALAALARKGITELSDERLEAARAVATMAPRFPLIFMLPNMLLDLNRPREAIARYNAILSPADPADSMTAVRRAAAYASLSEIWHYVGTYDSSLVAVRRARALRPSDMLYLNMELNTLAALGKLDEMDRLVPDVASAASNGQDFSFAGNVYITLANELTAHGHRTQGQAMAERARSWFEQHEADARTSSNVAVRNALTLAAVGRVDEAKAFMRERIKADTSDSRYRGLLGRFAAQTGDLTEARAMLAWLEARPSDRLQGAPTYERATIIVNLGREHWDEAIALLELSLKQGQGYGIRRRLHWFEDWLPLREYPPFQRVLAPRG